MAKNLIIVTGCPGCGKTSFAMRLREYFPCLKLISYDAIKEDYFDRYGFNSAEEKKLLSERSLMDFYQILNQRMFKGESLLIEYPFCKKHVASLKKLLWLHSYQAVTILLTGDSNILYQRGLQRNQSSSRHPGHLLNAYHLGDSVPPNFRVPAGSYEKFVSACREKDYNIQLGRTIPVDVSDFHALDYGAVFKQVETLIR